MTALQALILGILQGLSEFLPISSSGHLVLLQKLFGITEGSMSFSILVHFGTLVSLCVVMRDRLLKYLREPLGRVPRMVVLGTVPTVIVVLAFGRIFNDFFETGASLGAGFIFTALVLLLAEKIGEKYGGGYIKKKQTGGWEEVGASGGGRQPIEKKVTLKGALFVGVAQGIAVTPAVSRSGCTIAAGIISGFGRPAAIEFAFLMSIPVILMAMAQDVLKVITRGPDPAAADGIQHAINAGPLEMAIGFVAAAVTGYFAARFMLKAIQKIKLTWFSLYTGALGVLILLDQLVFGVVFDKLI